MGQRFGPSSVDIHPLPPELFCLWGESGVEGPLGRCICCSQRYVPGALIPRDQCKGEEVAQQGHGGGDTNKGLAQEREGGKEDKGAGVKVEHVDPIMRKHGGEEARERRQQAREKGMEMKGMAGASSSLRGCDPGRILVAPHLLELAATAS